MKKLGFFIMLSLLIIAISACSSQEQTTVDNTDGTDNTESTDSASNNENVKEEIDYPTKPITLIVPYAPGGLTDTAARALAEAIPKYLPENQSIGVKNVPGGSGVVGTTELVNSAADGYTIEFTPLGPIAIQPHYGETEYDYTAFTPIARVVPGPHAIAVKSDSPFETLDEWIEHAKQNPGDVMVAIAGLGGFDHIAYESFQKEVGIQTELVPFEGAAPAVNALLGGHVDAGIITSTDLLPYHKSGDFKILANASATKLDEYSDIPSLKEMGIDADADSPFFLVAPKGLPDEVRDSLEEATKQAMEDPIFTKVLENTNLPAAYLGSEDSAKLFEESYIRNGEVLKEIGMIK